MDREGLGVAQDQVESVRRQGDGDFRNLPTVQMGEKLGSMYLSDQRMPPREGEPSNSTIAPPELSSRDSTTPQPLAISNPSPNPKSSRTESSETIRRRIPETSPPLDETSSLSTTPSTPPTVSSGQSYSGEMNDELTPLREALPPAISIKRRSIGNVSDEGGNRRNASSSYAVDPPVRRPIPTEIQLPLAVGNIAGLTEILASPPYQSPNRRESPWERHGQSPLRNDGQNQIDYFNLPIHGESSKSNEARHPEREKEGTSTPSWSSSDVTSGTQSSSLRSPRIRNEGMLAPHGSFTSDSGRQYQARAKLERAQNRREYQQQQHDDESIKSGDSVNSWRSRTASERSGDANGRRHFSEDEYLENVRAARRGDQLAIYHLGWGPVVNNERQGFGDAQMIWGGVQAPGSPTASSQSSATSRPSARSNSTSGSFPRHLSGKSKEEKLREALARSPEARPKAHSRHTSNTDMFADLAQMTLRSNASNNRSRTATQGSDKPASPGRPSLFKSASYVYGQAHRSGSGWASDSATASPSATARRSKRREKDEGIEKDQDRDPEKELERRKRRELRRAARKDLAGSDAISATGSNATARNKKKNPTPASISTGRTAISPDLQRTPRPKSPNRSPGGSRTYSDN